MGRDYLDIGPSLQIFKRNKDGATIFTDADLDRLSLRNIVNTNHKERLWNKDFGGNIYAYVFNLQGLTSMSIESFRTLLADQIKEHNPNIELQGVVITAEPDSNILFIKIIYSKTYDLQDENIKVKEVEESFDLSSIYGG